MKYYLGPIPWRTKPFPSFGLPAGALGMIDLAPLLAQSVGGSDRPVCVCWSSSALLPSEYTLIGDGDCRELTPGAAVKSAFQSLVGYRPQGTLLVELIYDCLLGGADPDGQSGPMPLVPGTNGWLDLWMPGHSRVLGERFEWGRSGSRGSNHTAKLKQLLRKQFTQLMDLAQQGKLKDAQQHRRILDAWCDKYGLQGADDWREFVPTALQKDVPGRLKHETTITENFTRSDSTTQIGNVLTWTQVSGTWGTFSNAAYKASTANVNHVARAESDLSSSDHYAQVVVSPTGSGSSATSASFYGPCARFDGSAATCYLTGNFSDDQYISKIVSGTATNLTSAAHTYANDETYKLECNGSTLTIYVDGSPVTNVTDTSIAGNTRCGLESFGVNATMDDFEAADLAAAGILYTQLERSTRGLMRGMFTYAGG